MYTAASATDPPAHVHFVCHLSELPLSPSTAEHCDPEMAEDMPHRSWYRVYTPLAWESHCPHKSAAMVVAQRTGANIISRIFALLGAWKNFCYVDVLAVQGIYIHLVSHSTNLAVSGADDGRRLERRNNRKDPLFDACWANFSIIDIFSSWIAPC
jgi:hypothetical protein